MGILSMIYFCLSDHEAGSALYLTGVHRLAMTTKMAICERGVGK
jgi:hypothetical protein